MPKSSGSPRKQSARKQEEREPFEIEVVFGDPSQAPATPSDAKSAEVTDPNGERSEPKRLTFRF